MLYKIIIPQEHAKISKSVIPKSGKSSIQNAYNLFICSGIYFEALCTHESFKIPAFLLSYMNNKHSPYCAELLFR
jgi:hypothetical protein